jgi:hypothetical protein
LNTVCHKQLRFESLFSKEVIADLEGGQITSDAGGLLLRELDQRYRIAEKAAACLRDPRNAGKVKHDLLTLVRQRLFAIALGYEDNNDAAWLSKDPALKIMAGRAPESPTIWPRSPLYPGLRTWSAPKTYADSPTA